VLEGEGADDVFEGAAPAGVRCPIEAEGQGEGGGEQRQADGDAVEHPGALYALFEGGADVAASDQPAIDQAHQEAGEEDEGFGGGGVEAVAAGDRVEGRCGAADMVHDHRADGEAAQEIEAEIALAARVLPGVERGARGGDREGAHLTSYEGVVAVWVVRRTRCAGCAQEMV